MNSTTETTRPAPTGASYGVRKDSETGLYWAVTVPHEHGPFQTSKEAWNLLDEDQAEAWDLIYEDQATA